MIFEIFTTDIRYLLKKPLIFENFLINQANKWARLVEENSSGAANHNRHHEIAISQSLSVNCYNFCESNKPLVIKGLSSNFTVNICGSMRQVFPELNISTLACKN